MRSQGCAGFTENADAYGGGRVRRFTGCAGFWKCKCRNCRRISEISGLAGCAGGGIRRM
jgi:hypothetical protein